MINFIRRVNWDLMGMITSIACAIHCVVLPLLITSLPLFGINIIHNVFFEWMMIAIAFSIGSYALWHSYKNHNAGLVPLILFTIGFCFLILKQIFHQYEIFFLIPAVSCIVYAHFLNFRYFMRSKTQHKNF